MSINPFSVTKTEPWSLNDGNQVPTVLVSLEEILDDESGATVVLRMTKENLHQGFSVNNAFTRLLKEDDPDSQEASLEVCLLQGESYIYLHCLRARIVLYMIQGTSDLAPPESYRPVAVHLQEINDSDS